MEHRRYLSLPDPNGERYADGSEDEIISAGWPATYPTREDHVELHLDGFAIDFNAEQLRWLRDNMDTLLSWIEPPNPDAIQPRLDSPSRGRTGA